MTRESENSDPSRCLGFSRYAHLSTEEAGRVAAEIWAATNGVNIAPTMERADLILGEDHQVLGVRLRKS